MQETLNSWQAVHDEVLRRIHARDWAPGDLIPNETDLAAEFGCARATVNRALRTLAENGVLDRRRKAGTRVALHPISKAILDIPVIRHEIEQRGQTYGYVLLQQKLAVPQMQIQLAMHLAANTKLLHVKAVHMADNAPYVIEDRWINQNSVSGANSIDFSIISANEWLLSHAPYTHGDITFSAVAADAHKSELLAAQPGDALFEMHRTTWDHDIVITTVCLSYAPGHKMKTTL
ncbi:GntR family transcriptional regulator [Parasulfitobacter algicola]|uniref:UTRA domain-containing protein n=1 Tax=Parasulfitobacter algicola TaxID=2614809 RepID=A0ABX2ITB7_9RHOB|nr:GntR family transcriptional regulator [Sulfitobacter algicola]NSX56147.1 UTRA domain-containing protein [Sulfitobacter algicola]